MQLFTTPLKLFSDPSIRRQSEHPAVKKLLLILRLSLFIVLAFAELTANAKSQEPRISITEKKVPLQKIFKLIESKTDYTFYYQNELLENVPPVSITINNALVEDILEILFKQLPISYRIIENNIVIKAKTVSRVSNNLKGSAQLTGPVKGKVVDENGAPLEGVTVALAGSSIAAKTDANGNYLINSGQADSVLVFSFVGYTTKRINIEGRETINLDLSPVNGMMSDIVVVGYGTQKKSLVTGAISSIKASEFSNSSTTSIDQVLQGRVAGVAVSTNSGMPGEAMRVRIRGVGSNGNSEPLYLVDGIVVSNLSNLDPSEISSIEVLKDAASAAIYGAQGANGVVIVSTKTGKKGVMSIDLNTQYGSSTLQNLPKMMNAVEYTTYLREAGVPNVADPATVGKSTDWINAIIKPAKFQRYTLNISGGSDKSTYLVGGSITDQQGIIGGPNAEFRRYSFRVNSDHVIKPWLKIGERLSYSNNIQTSIPQENGGSVVGGAVMMDPLTPLVYTGELPANVKDAIANGYKPVQDDNGNYYGIGAYPSNEFSNPLAVTQINHNKNTSYIFSGNVYMDIEPLKGLKFTSRYGIESNSTNIRNWAPSYWMGPYKFGTTASVFSGNNSNLHWQWENFVSYQRSIGNHNFSLLAGTSAIKNSSVTMGTTGRGLLLEEDQFAELNFVSSSLFEATGNQGSNTLQSYYGRLTYDYAGKYLFNTTIRRDGSSVMAPGHQWGTFPSASVGWVISKENFFSSITPVINNLKLRGSWGKNGSISNVTVGAWNSVIVNGVTIRYPIDNNNTLLNGTEPNNLPNYDLKWETSEQTDVGLDVGLLRNHLTVSADYFVKLTRDLLTPGVAPGYTGFSLPFINGGNVKNSGIELELSYRNDDRPFKYGLSFNVTAIKNKVTYLNPIYPRILSAVNRITYSAFEKGYPIWYFYGYKTEGIFQSQKQIDDYVAKENLSGYNPKPGDPIIQNTKKDGSISNDDMTNIGSPYPDYTFGTHLDLSYKGFDLLVFVQGQVGNKILLAFNRTDFPYSNKLQYWYTQRWTGENSTNSFFRADVDNPFVYGSDMMIFNGSFVRIKQLQVGYTLPKKLTSKIGLNNLRIYASMDDYFTFTKYPGMDPEGGTHNGQAYSVDNMMYPVSGRILFGLNLKF